MVSAPDSVLKICFLRRVFYVGASSSSPRQSERVGSGMAHEFLSFLWRCLHFSPVMFISAFPCIGGKPFLVKVELQELLLSLSNLHCGGPHCGLGMQSLGFDGGVASSVCGDACPVQGRSSFVVGAGAYYNFLASAAVVHLSCDACASKDLRASTSTSASRPSSGFTGGNWSSSCSTKLVAPCVLARRRREGTWSAKEQPAGHVGSLCGFPEGASGRVSTSLACAYMCPQGLCCNLFFFALTVVSGLYYSGVGLTPCWF